MTPEEQGILVGELEKSLSRLHALYNQYFMGIEKIEPLIPRKEIDRKIQLLRKEQIRNTATRFRFQSQIQKYNTQSTYWRRICKQIEEGTYQRDLMRAKDRTKHRDASEIAERALDALGGSTETSNAPLVIDISSEMGMDLDDPFAEAKAKAKREDDTAKVPIRQAQRLANEQKHKPQNDLSSFFSQKLPRPPKQKRRASLPPPSPPKKQSKVSDASCVVSEDRIKAVYRAYSTARKKTNEGTISYQKISNLLEKQLKNKPDIKDFKVVIRNGKAIIKTVKN